MFSFPLLLSYSPSFVFPRVHYFIIASFPSCSFSLNTFTSTYLPIHSCLSLLVLHPPPLPILLNLCASSSASFLQPTYCWQGSLRKQYVFCLAVVHLLSHNCKEELGIVKSTWCDGSWSSDGGGSGGDRGGNGSCGIILMLVLVVVEIVVEK